MKCLRSILTVGATARAARAGNRARRSTGTMAMASRDFVATSEKDLVAALELPDLQRARRAWEASAKKAGAGRLPFSIQYWLFAL